MKTVIRIIAAAAKSFRDWLTRQFAGTPAYTHCTACGD